MFQIYNHRVLTSYSFRYFCGKTYVVFSTGKNQFLAMRKTDYGQTASEATIQENYR